MQSAWVFFLNPSFAWTASVDQKETGGLLAGINLHNIYQQKISTYSNYIVEPPFFVHWILTPILISDPKYT